MNDPYSQWEQNKRGVYCAIASLSMPLIFCVFCSIVVPRPGECNSDQTSPLKNDIVKVDGRVHITSARQVPWKIRKQAYDIALESMHRLIAQDGVAENSNRHDSGKYEDYYKKVFLGKIRELGYPNVIED